MAFDTKIRSVVKSMAWRILATVNSFIVLLLKITDSALYNALLMAMSGILLYYVYERIWDSIKWGKINGI